MSQFQTVTRLGPYSVGEVVEPLTVTIKDADGVALNLTSYTAKFVIEAVGQTVSGLGAGSSSIPAPATNGQARYAWAAADFLTAGMYRGQMWVGDGTNRYASEVYEWFVTSNTTAPNV